MMKKFQLLFFVILYFRGSIDVKKLGKITNLQIEALKNCHVMELYS